MHKDKEVLEKVQRRATRMIRGFGALTYEERLERCGLTTLDKRRCRGDLIETYKIMTNKETTPVSRFFKLADRGGLQGHRYKKIFRKSEGSYVQRFFSSRVINAWNELSDETVSASSVGNFKARLGQIGY